MANQASQRKTVVPATTATSAKAKRSGVVSSAVRFESPLYRHMRSKYQEHFRRVVSWRKGARWAVVLYPIFTAIFLAVQFVALRALFRHLYTAQPEWFTGVLPADSSSLVLQLCNTLAGVALVGGSVLGLSIGVARSRALYFEAERVEMNVRQSFYLNKIARKRKKNKVR